MGKKPYRIASLRHVLLLLLLSHVVSSLAVPQVRVFENGEPLMRGLDVGVHPDSPTRLKLDLNGGWEYSLDGSSWMKVQVPSAFDELREVILQRKFGVEEHLLDSRVFKLVALGINHEAEVSLNGVFLGRNVGGYSTIELEVPDGVIQRGSENVLRITVRNTLTARSTLPVRKQVWGWRSYAGITRDIYLLATPRRWIDAVNVQTALTEGFRQGSVDVVATLTGREAESVLPAEGMHVDRGSFFLQLELYDKLTNALIAQSSIEAVMVEPNRNHSARVSLPVPTPKLWSPDTPELYKLRVVLLEARESRRGVADEVYRNIGFRDVRIDGESFVVNGKRTELRGVVWHEDSPDYGSALTYEVMEKDVALIRTLGANAIRFAFHPPHPYMLNLCSRYGLFALLEIPVWSVPASILAEESFQVLAEGSLRAMIARDRHHPAVLAWGIGTEFDSANPQARGFVESLAKVARSLDGRPVYFGSRMLANDRAADLVDIAAVSPPSTELKTFKSMLASWKERHEGKPVLVIRYARAVEPGNRNGYSDPLSEEAHARHFEQYFRAIREVGIAGSFIDAFADWRGDRPVLTLNIGEPRLHTVGLLSYAREKRLAFDVVRSLYNDEKLTALPIGSYRAAFPSEPLLAGLGVIFVTAYFFHYNRRFSDAFSRSLLRPYNFFADLRDVHAVPVSHTLLVAVAIALTLAIIVTSFLYQFRTDEFVDVVVTQLFVSDAAKLLLTDAAWNVLFGIALFTAVFVGLLVFAAIGVKLLSGLVKTKVFWYHALSVVVWGGLPVVFLVFPGIILLKLLESPFYVLPSLLLVGVFLLWATGRVLKGVSVIYDIPAMRAYAGGVLFCLLVVAVVVAYYDTAYALLAYVEFILNHAQSIG